MAADALPCPQCGTALEVERGSRRGRCPRHLRHRPRIWRGRVHAAALEVDDGRQRIWALEVGDDRVLLRTAPGETPARRDQLVTLARGGERISVRDDDTGRSRRLVHREPSPALRAVGTLLLWVLLGLVGVTAARDGALQGVVAGATAIGVATSLVGLRRGGVATASAALLLVATVALGVGILAGG